MDDYRDVDEAHKLLLEKMILDLGMRLPDVYDGLYRRAAKEHNRRVNALTRCKVGEFIYQRPKR